MSGWKRWLVIWTIGGALMWWNVSAVEVWHRLLSAFLLAWVAAFEAATRR